MSKDLAQTFFELLPSDDARDWIVNDLGWKVEEITGWNTERPDTYLEWDGEYFIVEALPIMRITVFRGNEKRTTHLIKVNDEWAGASKVAPMKFVEVAV